MMTKFKIRQDARICFVIVIAILAVYWQVGNHEFVSLDDGVYVTENPLVQAGFTLEGLQWAFSFNDRGYWQPLTWLSHMLDCQLFGLRAGMHHLTNLIIHIVNSILLFWVFNRMTGARWKSAFVAALFALHPINVESVAWVAGRKNLLSTFFWMITILAYIRYSERTNVIRYVAVLLTLALGLLTKPMLVTLPFVLLLLDYWPMARFRFKQPAGDGSSVNTESGRQRFQARSGFYLFAEKVPFFLLSALATVLSAASVREYGIVVSDQTVPMYLRIANALVSYVQYIVQFIWPDKLAAYYPYPDTMPVWMAAGALAILAGFSILVLQGLKKAPYLAVGWLWYLGTLVPAIGLIQAGLWPARADRWAYVPLIGIFVMTAWGVPEIFSRCRFKRIILTGASAVIFTIAMAVSSMQVQHWRDSIVLFENTVRNTQNNAVAHANLGLALASGNRSAEGLYHYYKALRIDPTYAQAHNNLGLALVRHGKTNEAIGHLQQAAHLAPNSDIVQNNLGYALMCSGSIDSAIEHFQEALRINSSHAPACNNLGLAMIRNGKIEQAIVYFNKATQLRPAYGEAHKNLKLAIALNEKIKEAADSLLFALQALTGEQESYARIGELLICKKALNRILRRYQKSLSQQPGSAGVDVNEIPTVYEAKKAYDEALSKFMQISILQPEIADVDYHIACIYARKDESLKSAIWLKKAIQKGFKDWDLISVDPDLESIRSSSDYRKMLQDMRMPTQSSLSDLFVDNYSSTQIPGSSN